LEPTVASTLAPSVRQAVYVRTADRDKHIYRSS